MVWFYLKTHLSFKGLYFLIAMLVYFLFLIWAYCEQKMDISGLSVCLYVAVNLTMVINEMIQRFETLYKEFYSVKELFSFFDSVTACDLSQSRLSEKNSTGMESNIDAKKLPYADYAYDWEVKNLSYRYQGATEYVLKGIDLKIRRGEKIAIVGLNGAGKSTLIKCMTGLYKNYEGSILYRGVDLRTLPEKEYTKALGVLFQDADLYPFKITENLASSDLDIDLERERMAVESVDLENQLLQDGIVKDQYFKKLFSEEGMELSGGEIQRAMIARLIYKNPESIILDEPTARMDSFAEKSIFSLLLKQFEKKSILLVTHRLSSIIEIDRIFLLKNGSILESGTHYELMEREGEYYKMYKLQQSFYEENADDALPRTCSEGI